MLFDSFGYFTWTLLCCFQNTVSFKAYAVDFQASVTSLHTCFHVLEVPDLLYCLSQFVYTTGALLTEVVCAAFFI